MSTVAIGGLLLFVLLLLLGGGVWIAMALAIVGWVGQAFFTTTPPGKNLFTAFWETTASWELAALPLFIWMGEILFRTKLSEQMFTGLAPWLNRVPGRLMHTTILGCGIFGSVSGSSAATCATIAKVALPELVRRGYDERLAIGALASAGGLGILIPPSITMVVYAVAADASVIRLFLAGFIPAAVLMALFSFYIGWWSLAHPDRVPAAEASLSFFEKLRRSASLIPCALLILFIVWVLVAGWATATECAAWGVLGSLAIAAAGGSLTWRNFWDGLAGATRMSCMIMFILAGAAFLSKTMAFTLRPRLVRHLHRAAGRDRRGHAAGRLQSLRAAEHDRQGQQRHRTRDPAVLLLPGGDDRHPHRGPAARDLAAGRGDGQVEAVARGAARSQTAV
jgi:tripartite ATP-independent transporter DctM subunit